MRAYQLTESKTPTLYHGSRKKFPIGMVLKPQSDGYVHSDDDNIGETESILDSYRPSSMLSRNQSVFMVDDPEDIDYAGGYDDYIYIVEPIGKVERNDLHWYSELSMYAGYNDDMDDEFEQWASNYWNGVYSGSGGIWEYRAKAAKIVGIL